MSKYALAIFELIMNSCYNNEYHYIERELSEQLGTKVKINGKKIEISFANMNDLDRLLEIMNFKIN